MTLLARLASNASLVTSSSASSSAWAPSIRSFEFAPSAIQMAASLGELPAVSGSNDRGHGEIERCRADASLQRSCKGPHVVPNALKDKENCRRVDLRIRFWQQSVGSIPSR